MPTYEYKCMDCGHKFEKFQSMKDKSLERCPECNGAVQRLPGAGAAVLFKDSSLYATGHIKNSSPSCDRDKPCCGRDTPCDKKSCESQF